MKLERKKSRIFFDMMLNICASALPIILLQLFILPKTAIKLGEEQYGLMLTMVSLTSMVSLALGNVLNNVRLLRQNNYDAKNEYGDFNRLLAFFGIINLIIVTIVSMAYTGCNFKQTFFTLVASELMLFNNYATVWFRIELNYKKVLINSLVHLVGYVFGFFLFIYMQAWQLIYISSYGLSCFYILLQHNFFCESWKRTMHYRHRLNDCMSLSVATIISSALTYIDKLLLYPLLGGAAVSIYYSAGIIGKICSMVVSPISSVMLSYLAKTNNFQKKTFYQIIFVIFAMGIIGYFVCIFAAKPILFLLYPNWAEKSIQIIKITTATAMITLAVSFINPVVLRFCNLNRQVLINSVSLVIYMVLCLGLVKAYGLKGFAVGVLLATTIKLVLVVAIFLTDYEQKKTERGI